MVGTQPFDQLRGRLLEQVRAAGVRVDSRVAAALTTVARHVFLDDGFQDPVSGRFISPADPEFAQLAHSDQPLMVLPDGRGGLAGGCGRPSLVARILTELDLKGGAAVLEVGTDTGYTAALLVAMGAGRVVSVEHRRRMYLQGGQALRRAGAHDRVVLLNGDGYYGYRAGAPYDRILVTAGVDGISAELIGQLRPPGGVLLAPLAHGGQYPLVRIRRDGARVTAQAVTSAACVPATGLLRLPRCPPAGKLAVGALPPAVFSRPPCWPDLSDAEYAALWFWVAAHHPQVRRAVMEGLDRSRGGCTLLTPDGEGAAVLARDGAVYAVGRSAEQATAAARQLAAGWHRAGRPALAAWSTSLRLTGLAGRHLFMPDRWRLTEAAGTGGHHPVVPGIGVMRGSHAKTSRDG